MYFGVRTRRTPGVVVHEEHRCLRGIAVHVGVDQEEVGHVAARHVPLLAVQESNASPSRRAVVVTIDTSEPAPSSVNRIGVAALAAAGGSQEAVLLLLGARGERDQGRHGMSQSAPVARPHCSSISITWKTS